MRQVHIHVHDDYRDMGSRTYKVEGPEDFLVRLDQFMAQVEHMGAIGHSGVAGFSVDGDGADRMKVVEPKLKLKGDIKTRGTYPDQHEYVAVPEGGFGRG